MSSNDQQYPYPYGEQPYDGQQSPPYEGQQGYDGQQPYEGQPYGDPAQGAPVYGQQPQQFQQHPQRQQPQHPQPQQSYGGQAPYGAYEPHAGDTGATGAAAAQWPTGQSEPGAFDQGATQTWQAQTWDTQYQPTIQPLQPQQPLQHQAHQEYPEQRPQPQQPQPQPQQQYQGHQRHPQHQQHPAAATDAAYLPPQGDSGSYPLPPEVPDASAAGWFRLNGMWPARQGIALAFAGGFVADVALLAAGRENGPAALLGTLGVWVLLTVVLQLRSHAGADERMYGLMATVVSAALAVLAAGHLAAVPDAVTVGGVAVAAAVLVRALPLPGAASVVVALLVAAGAGLAMGGFTDFGTKAVFLGLVAGGCALIGLRVASYDYPSRFVHMTAGVALPLTAAAPAVYLIGRVIA